MKKRIAFVTNPMIVGGVERALIALLNEIDYSRYEVVLWTKSIGGDFEKQINPNVKIHSWNTGNSRKRLTEALKNGRLAEATTGLYYRYMLRTTGRDWVINEYYEAKAQEICDDKPYDAVIAYQGLYSGVIATALYRLCSPVKIAWIHGEHSFSQEQVNFLAKEYGKFSHLFCVSESIRKQFCLSFPDIYSKTSVFYNIIDVQEIRGRSLEKTDDTMKRTFLLTVGRISKPKGQILIPKTTRMLLDDGYEIYWYLVGDGELRQAVEDEIKRYGVQDHVILLGTKMNPYPYIKNCDIYVQPSFTEGWGLTVQEARILEKPIVVTPIPVMEEQIRNGENGLIVEAMTPEAIADGIRQLLDHPELMEKFTNALKNETFDNSAELQKLYDLIES